MPWITFTVGSADNELVLYADGLIDAQDNDIETTGDISAGDVNASTVEIDEVLRNTNSKVIADGNYYNPFKWAPEANGDYMSFVCRVTMHVEYTANTLTYHYVYSKTLRGVMVREDATSTGTKATISSDTEITHDTGPGAFTPIFTMGTSGPGTAPGLGPYRRGDDQHRGMGPLEP